MRRGCQSDLAHLRFQNLENDNATKDINEDDQAHFVYGTMNRN